MSSLLVLLTDLGPHFDPKRGPLGLTFSRFFRVWTPLGPYWPPLGPLVPVWVPFWTLWASFWCPCGFFGLHFRAPWVQFSNLFGCVFQQKPSLPFCSSIFSHRFVVQLSSTCRRFFNIFGSRFGRCNHHPSTPPTIHPSTHPQARWRGWPAGQLDIYNIYIYIYIIYMMYM